MWVMPLCRTPNRKAFEILFFNVWENLSAEKMATSPCLKQRQASYFHGHIIIMSWVTMYVSTHTYMCVFERHTSKASA